MSRNLLCLALLATLHATSFAAPRPSVLLGKVEFPVSAPEPARRHFLRGMLALHSFWYEEARDEFREATRIAPSFAMGYWGEALSYYHPIWEAEDVAASRAAIAKIPAGATLTERERGFVEAARLLFGDGERDVSWHAYAEALRRLHEKLPKDDEAATLYSVALLGASPRSGRFRPYAEAAMVSLGVLAHNPDHPGAVHYVIHAFDDPEHAILALPAARRYAQIAPAAYHALHMPSHIFVQLGMWDEAKASNEASWAASVAAGKAKHLDPSHYDFHSLEWLVKISLERGERRRASEVLGYGFSALKESHDPGRMPLILGETALSYMLATNDWARFDELLQPLVTVAAGSAPASTRPPEPGCAAHAVVAPATRAVAEAQLVLAFARGERAFQRHEQAELEQSRQAAQAAVAQLPKNAVDDWRSLELMLGARVAELRGAPKDAIELLRQAIALEEREPPSGPASGLTAREQLGELLLAQNRPAEALVELRRSLELHPRRSRSLLAAARAAVRAADPAASGYYAQLVANWSHADAGTPGLDEARTGAATAAR
jgi:hypothetical protein